jgi:hypothetical protein
MLHSGLPDDQRFPDRIDARLIAQILKKGFLPVVAIADQQTRQIRKLLRYWLNLVTNRSRNIF